MFQEKRTVDILHQDLKQLARYQQYIEVCLPCDQKGNRLTFKQVAKDLEEEQGKFPVREPETPRPENQFMPMVSSKLSMLNDIIKAVDQVAKQERYIREQNQARAVQIEYDEPEL